MKRAWIANGRPGVPPTLERIAEFSDKEAALAEMQTLRDQLMSESGNFWLWMKEVEPPSGDA